jgi:hypothetical protein
MASGWPKSVVAPGVAFVISFAVVFLGGWAFQEAAPAPLPRSSPNSSVPPPQTGAPPPAAAPAPQQLIITVTLNSNRRDLEPSAVVEKLSIRQGDDVIEDIEHPPFEKDGLPYQPKNNKPVTVCLTLKQPWKVNGSKPMDMKPPDPHHAEANIWCTKGPVDVQTPIQFDLGGDE